MANDSHQEETTLVRLWPYVPVGVAALVFAALTAAFWDYTVDDAFISFRYARNLAQGYGLTYNAGGPPIEGYTGLLWVLLMAVPARLGLDVEVFAKVVGVLATLACMAVTFRLSLRLIGPGERGQTTFAAGMAILLLAAQAETAIHTVAGLETALYSLLLTAFLYQCLCSAEEQTNRCLGALAFTGLLLGLTRPEGNLPVLVGLLTLLPMLQGRRRSALVWSALLLYVLPGLAYFLWRFHYYGQLLPLPFYLKAANQQTLAGLRGVVGFLATYGTSALGVLMCVAAIRFKRTHAPGLLASLSLLVFFLFPAHIMGYCFRFLYPLVPAICALGGAGLALLLTLPLSSQKEGRPWARHLPAIALCLLLAVSQVPRLPGAYTTQVRYYAAGLQRAHIALGKCLAEFKPAGRQPVLAIGDAGAVPYYSGWRTIDIFGLNEPHIALSREHDPEYVLSQHPDVLVLISSSATVFVPHLDREADLYHASLARGMRPLRAMEFDPHRYYLWVLAFPGSDVWEHLKGATCGMPLTPGETPGGPAS
ncbi:hypothetical protein LLH03_18245 [bacterium]|nr:hypothetical protein [bacterium]